MRHATSPVVSFEDEDLICVDENDQILGHASKSACHDGDGTLHRALSVFVFNKQGKVLLQQRSDQKRLWPKWWANACCSHPRRGESVARAAQRRLFEELELQCPLVWTHRFIYRAGFGAQGTEYELCHVFIGCVSVEPRVNANEVSATRWVLPTELDALVADAAGSYTPWLRLEWQALRQYHWQRVEQLIAGKGQAVYS